LLFTQAQFQVPVGEYELAIRVKDENSSASAGKTVPLSVQPFHPQTLSLSDLQFATLIEKDTTVSLFYKNNYLVVPNPAALYGAGLPMLFTYSEIYNLSFPGDSAYTVSYRVLDANGREVKARQSRRRIMGRSLVEVSQINITALPSGTYSLEQRVSDLGNGQQAVNVRKFFVYRVADPAWAEGAEALAGASDALAEHYRAMSVAELDEEFAAARYIANNDEKKVYGSLNEAGKREFMVRFWSDRDQTPATARNEYRESYLERVAFANKNYSGLRQGWKTDMGRVLLIYGFPSEIERAPFGGETRPHQVWKYFEYEGGVEFVFVDLKGWGNYELVNSTARNELQDPDWERWLRTQ
jgi:GWxTD domain-containing protein